MDNQEKVMPTHKWIVINDMNRELSPIGYGFQSPIYKPSKFPVEVIGQLLNISKVTAMLEVYEPDDTLRVRLDKTNYRKPFEVIWAEQNPGTPFPWASSVQTAQVGNEQSPVATTTFVADKVETETPPAEVEDESKQNAEVVTTSEAELLDGKQSTDPLVDETAGKQDVVIPPVEDGQPVDPPVETSEPQQSGDEQPSATNVVESGESNPATEEGQSSDQTGDSVDGNDPDKSEQPVADEVKDSVDGSPVVDQTTTPATQPTNKPQQQKYYGNQKQRHR